MRASVHKEGVSTIYTTLDDRAPGLADMIAHLMELGWTVAFTPDHRPGLSTPMEVRDGAIEADAAYASWQARSL